MLVRCPHRLALALLAPQSLGCLPAKRMSSTAASSPDGPPARSSKPAVDLLDVYRKKVEAGDVKWDDTQVRIVVQLRALHRILHNYTPPAHLLLLSQPLPTRSLPSASSASPSWWPFNRRKTDSNQSDESLELARILSVEEELANLPSPQGVLLIGPPGSGKTFLLDMLFDHLEIEGKTRRHYHSFLLHIYRLIYVESLAFRLSPSSHDAAQALAVSKGWKSVFAGGQYDDPTSALPRRRGSSSLPYVSESGPSSAGSGSYQQNTLKDDELAFRVAKKLITEEGWLILFDDLQLLDPPSTHLLRSVLLHYWRLGGVILSTSNRVPEDLYTQGVMRKRMEGFLACLRSRCEVLEVDGGRDWRALEDGAQEEGGGSWVTGPEQLAAFEDRWRKEVGDKKVEPHTLMIYNRPVTIQQQTSESSPEDGAGRIARFTFQEICETSLGPADYLTISSTYSTIFISAVPPIRVSMKNEARRLINLLDALYESRTRIHIHALVPLKDLFFADASEGDVVVERDSLEEEALSEMEKEMDEPTRPNVALYEYQELKKKVEEKKKGGGSKGEGGGTFANLAIFTGEDERFAFKRALSRLVEMTNPTYRQRPWTPLPLSIRSWESAATSSPPASSQTGSISFDRPRTAFVVEGEGDFASEASYDARPMVHAKTGPREDAPKLKESHFWGVAGTWGSGSGKKDGRGDKTKAD